MAAGIGHGGGGRGGGGGGGHGGGAGGRGQPPDAVKLHVAHSHGAVVQREHSTPAETQSHNRSVTQPDGQWGLEPALLLLLLAG